MGKACSTQCLIGNSPHWVAEKKHISRTAQPRVDQASGMMKGLISAAGDAWNMSSWTPKNGDAVGYEMLEISWRVVTTCIYNIL
jgi:hypothetical protein